MPLGRKHLRRSRDAPTRWDGPSKNYFYSAELVPASQLPIERSPVTGSQLSVQAFLALGFRSGPVGRIVILGRDELAAISEPPPFDCCPAFVNKLSNSCHFISRNMSLT